MIRLLYTSKATHRSGQRSDFQILDASVRHNTDNNITGYLIRTDERFFQILEGEEDDVMALLERIKQDPRNHDLHILLKDKVTQRHFRDWSMGFKILSPAEAEEFDAIGQMGDDEVHQLVPRIYNIATSNSGVFQVG